MKKIITVLVCLFFCVVYTNLQAQNEQKYGVPPQGLGTLTSPYIVLTPENFYWVLESSVYTEGIDIALDGKYIKLNNDITIAGQKMPDIDTSTRWYEEFDEVGNTLDEYEVFNSFFSGILDGNGYKVTITGEPKPIFSNIHGESTVAEIKNITFVMNDDVYGMTLANSVDNANIENVTITVNGDVKCDYYGEWYGDYYASGFANSIINSTLRDIKVTANNIGGQFYPPSKSSYSDDDVYCNGFVSYISNTKLYNIDVTIKNEIFAVGQIRHYLAGAIYQIGYSYLDNPYWKNQNGGAGKTIDERKEFVIDGFKLNIGDPTNKDGGIRGEATSSSYADGFVNNVLFRYDPNDELISFNNVDLNINGDISVLLNSDISANVSGFVGKYYDNRPSKDGVYSKNAVSSKDVVSSRRATLKDRYSSNYVTSVEEMESGDGAPSFQNISVNVTGDISVEGSYLYRDRVYLSGFAIDNLNKNTKHIRVNIGGDLKCIVNKEASNATITGLAYEIDGASDIELYVGGSIISENTRFEIYGISNLLINASDIRVYVGGDMQGVDMHDANSYSDLIVCGGGQSCANVKNIGIIVDGDITSTSTNHRVGSYGFCNNVDCNGGGGYDEAPSKLSKTCYPLSNISVTVHGDILATGNSTNYIEVSGLVGDCSPKIENCTVYVGGSINATNNNNNGDCYSALVTSYADEIINTAAFLGGTISANTTNSENSHVGMFANYDSGYSNIENCTLILSPTELDVDIDAERYSNFTGGLINGTYNNNTLVKADGQFRTVYAINGEGAEGEADVWTITNAKPIRTYILNKDYNAIKTNVDNSFNTPFLMTYANVSDIYGYGSLSTTVTDNYKQINIRDNKSQIGFMDKMNNGGQYTFDILQVCPEIGKNVGVIVRDMISYQGGASLSSDSFPRPYFDIFKDGEKLTDAECASLVFYVDGNLFESGSQDATDMGLIYEYPFDAKVYDMDGNEATENSNGINTMEIVTNGHTITIKDGGEVRDLIYFDGKLEIKPISDLTLTSSYAAVTSIEPTTSVAVATAIVPNDIKFVNSAGISVIDDANSNIVLLADGICDADPTAELTEAIRNNASTQGMAFEFVYLDLVDMQNGNIVLTPDKKISVLLPYLENTNKNNPYQVLYFENVDRSGDVNPFVLKEITSQRTDYGLRFDVDIDGFGMFAIATEYEVSLEVVADSEDNIIYGKITYNGVDAGSVVYATEGAEFKFVPNDSHSIVSNVWVDDVEVEVADNYVFTNITDNHKLKVKFILDSYTITAIAGDNGSISDVGETTLRYGSLKSYTITPANNDYVIANVLVDGVSVGAVNTYTFNTLDADHTIEAKFACLKGIPYSENFDAENVLPDMPECTSLENAGEGNNWTIGHITSYGYRSTKLLMYVFDAQKAANAWFYTAGIELKGGTEYTLSFNYGNNTKKKTEKLKVCYGTAASHTEMKTELFRNENINEMIKKDASIKFTPAADGIYFIGFNAFSDLSQWNLFVDDIMVTDGAVINIVANEGGNITFNPNQVDFISTNEYETNISAPFESNVTLNIVPEEGYVIEDVLVDGNSVGMIEQYTFNRIYTSHVIGATFAPAATTGVDNLDIANAKIYAKDRSVVVNIHEVSAANIEVIDMSGRVVLKKDIASGETVINLNDNGVYVVRLVTAQGAIKTQKLLVK